MLRVTMLRFLTIAVVDAAMEVKIVNDSASDCQWKGQCFVLWASVLRISPCSNRIQSHYGYPRQSWTSGNFAVNPFESRHDGSKPRSSPTDKYQEKCSIGNPEMKVSNKSFQWVFILREENLHWGLSCWPGPSSASRGDFQVHLHVIVFTSCCFKHCLQEN